MSQLMRSNQALFPNLNSLIEDFWKTPASFNQWMQKSASLPAINVHEDDNEYRIEVAIPGYKKDEIDVRLDDRLLTISSQQRVEEEHKAENYSHKEFSFSSFERRFQLPEDADGDSIQASCEDGVLTLRVNKSEKRKENSRKIDIL